jgi:4-amino-4-deoxy-L-arabinose transferase-like glycosyltransferase
VSARLQVALAIVLLAAFSTTLVVSSLPRISMSFGLGHDGFNTAMWGGASRMLREEGPVTSRLGARQPGGGAYTNHPPAIVFETAASERAFGEHRWSTRLPAVVSSLLAVMALFWLLVECGCSPFAATAATALALGSSMFATYWTMLDTPVVGLPWGIGVVALWRRVVAGRDVPAWVVIAVAAGATVTSWLGAITVAAVALAAIRSRRQFVVRLVSGAALGAAVFVAWAAWGGGLSALVRQFGVRSGLDAADRVSVARAWSEVFGFWRALLPPWVVVGALIGVIVGHRHVALRTAALTVGVVLVWTGAFSQGAYLHDYWTYWIVVPCALAIGGLLDTIAHALRVEWAPVTAPAAAVLVAVGAVSVAMPGAAVDRAEHDAALGHALERATVPPTQRALWFVTPTPQGGHVLAYLTRRPVRSITTLAGARHIAAAFPHDVVVVRLGEESLVTTASHLDVALDGASG